jgi:hypothetical protein
MPVLRHLTSTVSVSGSVMITGGELMRLANLKLEDERVQGEDREYVLRYMPLGVVGAICPWNCTIIPRVPLSLVQFSIADRCEQILWDKQR